MKAKASDSNAAVTTTAAETKTPLTPAQQMEMDFRSRKPISGIKSLIFHPRPHLDEIASAFFLKHTDEGKKMFPGIENAQIAFANSKFLSDNKLTKETGFWRGLTLGYLLIGVGEGPFDEHGKGKQLCAAHLVADHLGLTQTKERRRIFGNILGYLNYEDRNGDKPELLYDDENPKMSYLKGNAHAFMPASLVKKAWRVIAEDAYQEQADEIEIVFHYFKHEITDQTAFYAEGERDFNNSLEYDLGSNKVMVVVKSDSATAGKYIRFKYGIDPACKGKKIKAILQVSKTGNFYISPGMIKKGDKQEPVRMGMIVKNLREKAAIQKKQILPFADYFSDGKSSIVPELYYQKEAEVIMNGSLTQTDVPPMIPKLLREREIINIMVEALKEEAPSKK